MKGQIRGLPWWLSGKESACQCKGHRFDPWSRKIPHASEQLSPRATITEPTRLRHGSLHASHTEAYTPHTRKPTRYTAHAPQPEKLPHREARTPHPEKSPHSSEELAQPKGMN